MPPSIPPDKNLQPRPPIDPKVEGILPAEELIAKYENLEIVLDKPHSYRYINSPEIQNLVEQLVNKDWYGAWQEINKKVKENSWSNELTNEILLTYLIKKYQASDDNGKINVLHNYITFLLLKNQGRDLKGYNPLTVNDIATSALAVTELFRRTGNTEALKDSPNLLLSMLKVIAAYLERRGFTGYASIVELSKEFWTGKFDTQRREQLPTGESENNPPSIQTVATQQLTSQGQVNQPLPLSSSLGNAPQVPVIKEVTQDTVADRQALEKLKTALNERMLEGDTTPTKVIQSESAEKPPYDLNQFRAKFLAELVESAATNYDKDSRLKATVVNLSRSLQSLNPQALVDFIKQTKKDAEPVDAAEDILLQHSVIFNVLQDLERKADKDSNEHKFINSLYLWDDSEFEEAEDDKPAFTRLIQAGNQVEVLPTVKKHFEDGQAAPLLLPAPVGEDTETTEAISTPFKQGKIKLEKLIKDSGLPTEEWKKSAEAIYSYLIYEKNPSRINWNTAPDLAKRIGVGAKSVDPMGILELIFDDQHSERFNPSVLYALIYSIQNESVKHHRQIIPILDAKHDELDRPFDLPVTAKKDPDQSTREATNVSGPDWLKQIQQAANQETTPHPVGEMVPFAPFEPEDKWSTEQFLVDWFKSIEEDSAHAPVLGNSPGSNSTEPNLGNLQTSDTGKYGELSDSSLPISIQGDIDKDNSQPTNSSSSQQKINATWSTNNQPFYRGDTARSLKMDVRPKINDDSAQPAQPIRPAPTNQQHLQADDSEQKDYIFDTTPSPSADEDIQDVSDLSGDESQVPAGNTYTYEYTPVPSAVAEGNQMDSDYSWNRPTPAPIPEGSMQSDSQLSQDLPNPPQVPAGNDHADDAPLPRTVGVNAGSQPLIDTGADLMDPTQPMEADLFEEETPVETPPDKPLPESVLRDRMHAAAAAPGAQVQVDAKNAMVPESQLIPYEDLQIFGRGIKETTDPQKYKEVFGFTGTILSQPLVGTDLYNYIQSSKKLSEASLDEWEEFVGLVNRIEADEAPTAKDKIVLSTDSVGDAVSKLWQIAKSGTADQKKRLLSYADEIFSRLRQKQNSTFNFYVEIRHMANDVKESRLKKLRDKAKESAQKLENTLRTRGSNFSSRLIDAGIQEGLFVLQKGKRAARALAHLFAKDEDAQVARDLGQAAFSAKPNMEAAQKYRERLIDVQSRIEALKRPNGIELIKTRTYRPVQNFLAKTRKKAEENAAQSAKADALLAKVQEQEYEKRRARRKLEFQNGNI